MGLPNRYRDTQSLVSGSYSFTTWFSIPDVDIYDTSNNVRYYFYSLRCTYSLNHVFFVYNKLLDGDSLVFRRL